MWTIDLKDKGTIYAGPVRAPAKAGVTLLLSDDTFEQLATGKVCSFAPPPSYVSLLGVSYWYLVFGSVPVSIPSCSTMGDMDIV